MIVKDDARFVDNADENLVDTTTDSGDGTNTEHDVDTQPFAEISKRILIFRPPSQPYSCEPLDPGSREGVRRYDLLGKEPQKAYMAIDTSRMARVVRPAAFA